MNIELKFDYHSCVLFIPDDVSVNIDNVQRDFLEWVFEQPDCIIKGSNNIFALSYDENDFIKYVNGVLLKDSKEKAYKITNTKHSRIQRVIKF